MTDKNGKKVTFRRIKGRLVPIFEKAGYSEKKVKNIVKEKAISSYYTKVPEKNRELVKKGFELGKKIFGLATAGITAAVVAKHADIMVGKYEERIAREHTKANLATGAGIVTGSTGIGLLIRNLRKKALTRGKFGTSLALSGLGLAALIGSKKGHEKLAKHTKIAKTLRKITSEANKYVGGTSVFQDL